MTSMFIIVFYIVSIIIHKLFVCVCIHFRMLYLSTVFSLAIDILHL